MMISMQNLGKLTLAEMEEFVDGSRKLTLSVEGEGAIYGFIEALLTKSATVSTFEQRPARCCTPVSGEGERAEPGANDPFDCPLDEDSPGTEAPGATASLSTTLYSGGHRLAGRGGWGASGLIRTGGSPHLGARVPDLPEAGVRTTGRHLGISYLQPAAVED